MPDPRVGADFEVTHHGRRDSGIVRLIGSITSASIFQVVDRMDALVADHYNEIVLELTSFGGEMTPLWRFLLSIKKLREQNIRLITQAYDNVGSAAAIMLSAGDVRLASVECRLLYHSGRINNAQDVTAADAGRLAEVLRSNDTSVAKRLMTYTGWNEDAILAELQTEHSMNSHRAECFNFIDMVGDYRNDTDLEIAKRRSEQSHTDILAHISSSLASYTDPLEVPDEAMIYAVGRLPKAIRVHPHTSWGGSALADGKIPSGTRKTIWDVLSKFGSALSTASGSVGGSGDLALLAELRSAVGGTKEKGLDDETATADRTTREIKRSLPGSMSLPQFRDHIPKHGDIPQAEVTRHFLALGETGSGKTESFIKPIVKGLLSFEPCFRDKQPGGRTSAFVVDPKNELLEYITNMCLERKGVDVRKIVLTGGQKSALRVNFDTLLVPGEGSDAQSNWLFSDPSRFELLATRIVERAASLDTTNMMNVPADQAGETLGIVMEARRALVAFVESLIWFRRYPEVAGPKWEEALAETEEQTEQSLVDEWKEHYRFIKRLERNATLRLNSQKDGESICSEEELSRLIVEADYCCQAQDMAIEFGVAAQRLESKGKEDIFDDPEMWLLKQCGFTDSFHERILEFFSSLFWADHDSLSDGHTVSRHPIRCCNYDCLVRLLGLSGDKRPMVKREFYDAHYDPDPNREPDQFFGQYEFYFASLSNFETEAREFRAAAKEWIGNFWQWWRDGGEGLVESTCIRFQLGDEVLERMWEEHVRRSNRMGVDRPTDTEHRRKFVHWLADTVVLRILTLVWSIPNFQQVSRGMSFGGDGRGSDDVWDDWWGARRHRWESPHYLENVFEFMPTSGLSRGVVLEALECSQQHWSVDKVEPEDNHSAVSDEIRAKVRKSFSQSRDPEVSKLLELRAKQRATQSLSRWCIQPQVNVFSAIRDNIEPLFVSPGDDGGYTSAYFATERVRSCLEAIEGNILTRMGSIVSAEDLVVGNGAENLASLEAGERELEHLYRLKQRLERVGRRGGSTGYRGDPLTGYFGGVLHAIAGSEVGSTVFFGIDWCEELDREYASENTDGGHWHDQSSVDDLISNPGTVFVFCPAGSNMSEEEEFIVRAAKSRLFEKCLVAERENLFKRDTGHVVAYVADEFQRFVTVGNEHGEQTFIDRCRSYGVCCVFATQSLSSLRYRLGTSSQAMHSLDIVLSNIGTKAFFRTTDREALGYLDSLLGIDLGSSKRGLPTLEVGACWLARANGSFSRRMMRLD